MALSWFADWKGKAWKEWNVIEWKGSVNEM